MFILEVILLSIKQTLKNHMHLNTFMYLISFFFSEYETLQLIQSLLRELQNDK